MTIADEITRIKTNISNAYTSCENKGATLPETQNSANLATTIDSISGGGLIEENYVFKDVADFSGLYFDVRENVMGERAMSDYLKSAKGLTDVCFCNLFAVEGNNAMNGTFKECVNLKNVALSKLHHVVGNNAMRYIFQRCSALENVDLSNLYAIGGNCAMTDAFRECSKLRYIRLDSLNQIGSDDTTVAESSQFSNCFFNCTNLIDLTFPSLEKIYCTGSGVGTFYNNNRIRILYFPRLKTITYSPLCNDETLYVACTRIFEGCSSLIEIHFGAENQEAIEATSGFSTLWGRGAGNATVYFDL